VEFRIGRKFQADKVLRANRNFEIFHSFEEAEMWIGSQPLTTGSADSDD